MCFRANDGVAAEHGRRRIRQGRGALVRWGQSPIGGASGRGGDRADGRPSQGCPLGAKEQAHRAGTEGSL